MIEQKILDVAISAAREAWDSFKDLYKKDLAVERKRDKTIVTEADKRSQKTLIARLRSAFPNHGIVSEESENSIPGDPTWYIDPLDGTSDFLQGTGDFAIQLGLVYKRKPVVAVVFAPERNELYYAVRGEGAFVEGAKEPLKVSQRNLDKAILVLSRKDFESGAAEEIERTLGVHSSFQSGSFGVKVGHIAQGRADCYFNSSSKAGSWDACAPSLILEEAGGKITDFDGSPIEFSPEVRYLPRGAVVSNSTCHDDFLRRVQQYIKLK